MKKIVCIMTIAILIVMTSFSTYAATNVGSDSLPNNKITNDQIFSIPWWNSYAVEWADIFGHEPIEETEDWEGMARGLQGYNIIDFHALNVTYIQTNYDNESYVEEYFITGDSGDVFSLRVKEAIPFKLHNAYFVRLNYSIYNCTTEQWVKPYGQDLGNVPANGSDPTVFGAITNVCIASEYLNLYVNGDLHIRTALYNALPINSPGYEQQYNVEYELGYQTGIQVGQEQYYNQGYGAGYQAGEADGYLDGYARGVADNEQGNTGFKKLINAVITQPINAILNIFNFEILGVNLSIFIRGLISVIAAICVIGLIKRWVL